MCGSMMIRENLDANINMIYPSIFRQPGDVVPGEQEAGAGRDEHLGDVGGDETHAHHPRRAAEARRRDQREDEQGPIGRAPPRRHPQ